MLLIRSFDVGEKVKKYLLSRFLLFYGMLLSVYKDYNQCQIRSMQLMDHRNKLPELAMMKLSTHKSLIK